MLGSLQLTLGVQLCLALSSTHLHDFHVQLKSDARFLLTCLLLGRFDSFDFSKLFENVVEGTVAGFSFRNSSRVSQEMPSQLEMYRSTRVTPPNSNHNVMVVLEIEHQASWLFESQIGAWKRILTNVFGNALKYTSAGFVRVACKIITPPEDSDKYPEIMLQIEDSGIGMSKEFLKHGIYTAFVQANPLSVGTGLGLSIVRQLVDDLDGTINVQSEVDFGTRITVKAPLKASSLEDLDLTAAGTLTSIRDIAAWCKDIQSTYTVSFPPQVIVRELDIKRVCTIINKLRSSPSTLLEASAFNRRDIQ